MKFGEKLKKFRKDRDYTQEQFANITGFSRSTITELESGRRKPTLRTIKKIISRTNTTTFYWIAEDSEADIIQFDGLKLVLGTLIESGKIDAQGNMSDEAKELLMKMLEKEVKLMVLERKG